MAKKNKTKKHTAKTKNEKSTFIISTKTKNNRKKKLYRKTFVKKNKQKKIMEKKKVAVPLKKLRLQINDDTINNLSLNDLKKLASKFDVNPKINYRLLYLLKTSKLKQDNEDYKKYINKYKYTLNYLNSQNLECFEESKNNEIKEEFINNLRQLKIEYKQTKSLSKMKLFNLLFYVLNISANEKAKEDASIIYDKIAKKIDSFSNEENLIFKIPNNFGNYELYYYVYIGLFVIYFLEGLKYNNSHNESSINTKEI